MQEHTRTPGSLFLPFCPPRAVQRGSLSTGVELKWEMGIKRLALSQSLVKSNVLPFTVPKAAFTAAERELHQQKSLEAKGCLHQPPREVREAGLALNRRLRWWEPRTVFSPRS